MKYRYSSSLILLLFLSFLVMIAGIIPARAMTDQRNPVMDASVSVYYPNTNYGSNDFLDVGADIYDYQEETYIKFLIPNYETKILGIYIETYWYSFSSETSLSVSACQVNNFWNEYTITWNDRPSHGAVIDNDPNLADGEYFIINIDVSTVTEGEYFSLCIYENTPYKPVGLRGNSREYGINSPKLIIEYETHPMVILSYVFGVIFIIVAIGAVVYVAISHRKKKRDEREPTFHLASPQLSPKFCPYCGKAKADGAFYCMECGYKF